MTVAARWATRLPESAVGGYVTGLANRLTNDGTFTYTYDNEGNMLTRTRISAAAADDKLTEYAWDHLNRLTKVTFKNNASAVTQSVTYTYDAQGRRVKRAFDANGAAAGGVSNEFFAYDGDQLSLTFGHAGELTHRYLHGPADQVLVDEVFSTVGSQQVSDEVLWLLSDHQGTPRDIVNDSGTLRKQIDYDSFGQVNNEQFYARNGSSISSTHAEAVEQLFGYTGQERDSATGLQLHGERWYDPHTARWLSEDPIGFDAGDPNLYRYVGNSPLNYTDPTGLIQAGNPLTNLNVYNGGYTGGKVATYRPPSTAIASGFKAIGNSVVSAGVGIVNNVYSAGANLASNFREISSLYSQANVLTKQINAVADRRANRGFIDSWFGPSESALNTQYNTLASQRLATNAKIENIVSTSIFGGPRVEIVSNPGGTKYNSWAGYAARGLGTGAKAVTNAAISTATIGYVNEAWAVNDFDRNIASYDVSRGIAGVNFEVLAGITTGGLATYSKAGTAARYIGKGALAFDTASNVVNVGRGVNDVYNNGLSFASGAHGLLLKI